MELFRDYMPITKYVYYKNSDAEWLGNIPSTWALLKMKYLFRDISIKGKPNSELLSVTQDQGVVPRTWVENRMVMPSGALHTFKYISKGDFAISLRSFEGGLEYCHHDGIISPAYTVLKASKNICNDYYKYLFKSSSFISELQTSVVGIRQGKNISYDLLCNSIIPIPTINEQAAIAYFLDKKTALIDQAVEIKQKQIELLKERKQILIQEAVTRGLNSNVRMKDSGVEWIGEIPEHWKVAAIKYFLDIPICDGPHTTPEILDEGIPFISAESIKNGEIDFSKKRGFISHKDHLLFCKKYKPKYEDVYMVKSGATTGNVAIVRTENEFSIWSPLAVFRANKYILSPHYLYYALQVPYFRKGVELKWSFGTQQNIGMGVLSNLPFVIPPLNEQNAIIDFIAKVHKPVENSILIKEQEIQKLFEYKSTLINSAVTGKIKVC